MISNTPPPVVIPQPEVETAATPLSERTIHTDEVRNPELQSLQDSFNDRLKQAKSELSKNPEARQAFSEALVKNFGLFQNSESKAESEDNFLALALAQCNLANSEGIAKLQQVFNSQDEFIAIYNNPTLGMESSEASSPQKMEVNLKALEGELGAISRQDNATTSGSYSMGVERQSFVEMHVEECFQEDIRQQVKDALMLIKNQMTSGADIGPIPESTTALKFGTADDLASFSASFKYPNTNIFSQARSEFQSKSGELEQHFAKKDDLTAVLQSKGISEDIMESVTQELSRPVSEMKTEAMVLAGIITHFSEADLKSYLKAAQILSLKTEAQRETPELSDNTAIARALDDSDAMVREHYKTGSQNAVSSAVSALVKSLTPLPQDMTTIV
ncbi:hypothetical protein [Endozoicomonas atrinae]|uniref:hypothetical protein n=1 Tax=Endozoicomonas atrinae TaxID=1333660 RepID=UPI000825D016|nr:hypothetical protein [Endozoicomonas atrinae]